jgi:hypothetical protein
LTNAGVIDDGALFKAWHFLAEGDSWFTIGAIPSSNLLFELKLAKWTRVLSIAYPGDTIINMGDLAGNKDLRKFLTKTGFNYPFHALLLSGGGNDVIDAAKDIIKPSKAPATFVGAVPILGPWLYPVFKDTGLNIGLQQRIVNRVMDALAQALLALDSVHGDPDKRLPAFHVIDTRNTLVQANPSEIHPNHDGYRKIADKLSAEINAVMLG